LSNEAKKKSLVMLNSDLLQH